MHGTYNIKFTMFLANKTRIKRVLNDLSGPIDKLNKIQ
jgi:hypothetical protein